MTAAGNFTRGELREAYADAWRKHRLGLPVTPLEDMLIGIIGAHPEFHPLLEDRAAAAAFEPAPSQPDQNPFLHMGLHAAVQEQLAVDRPPGIRAVHQDLQARCGDAHVASHRLMEALAETLWDAQRGGTPPDERRYLDLARRAARS